MKALICPLNWGLGHATRCVPLIRQYMVDGYDVTIAADGYPLEFLKQQFPQLRFIHLPSYPVRYSSGKSQVWAMIRSFPAFLTGIISEHQWLKKKLTETRFELVISDNRFGLWNKKTHSVYMTHQLMIKMPRALKFMEPLVWLIHRCFIAQFDECLIPDTNEKDHLSGDLSHKYPLPRHAKFIGILSRFTGVKPDMETKRFTTVAIVSGPEPQKTLFKNMLVEKYKNTPTETLLICGEPSEEYTSEKKGFITQVNHLPDSVFAGHLIRADKIVCRSGYSTIMDLKTLNCLHKAEFHPTPGQTEQEYLAKIHRKLNH